LTYLEINENPHHLSSPFQFQSEISTTELSLKPNTQRCKPVQSVKALEPKLQKISSLAHNVMLGDLRSAKNKIFMGKSSKLKLSVQFAEGWVGQLPKVATIAKGVKLF
jgi:hypothetical protein